MLESMGLIQVLSPHQLHKVVSRSTQIYVYMILYVIIYIYIYISKDWPMWETLGFDKFTPHPPHPPHPQIIIITIIIIIVVVVVAVIIIIIIIIIIKLPLTGLSTVFVHALFRAILWMEEIPAPMGL